MCFVEIFFCATSWTIMIGGNNLIEEIDKKYNNVINDIKNDINKT